VYLGAALSAGSVAALALALLASVRRRRRDFALLKTIGFTGRQLGATVAWQASILALAGTIVGLPLGIVAGRSAWSLFARSIHVVPRPSVPLGTLALVAIDAVANLVATAPGRQAARTPASTLLRGE
jgi:predicted lysophospholipase L1 biosynthesis ABC-type transport system permease subunit